MSHLEISYDGDRDVATIEGIQWHGDLLRAMCKEMPVGEWFKIINREDKVFTVSRVSPDVNQRITELVDEP